MKTLICSFLLSCVVLTSLAQGKFWGTTNGGWGDGGRIFKFDANGTNVKLVKTFGLVNGDGIQPYQVNPLLASDGKFYGVTTGGGGYDLGTVFSVDQTTLAFKKVFDIPLGGDNAFDRGAAGQMAEGPDGYLYGYINYKPSVVYKVKKDGTGFQKFTPSFPMYFNANGLAGLIFASDGNLYGCISAENNRAHAYLFRMTPSGQFSTVYDFGTSAGALGKLIQGSDGRLYAGYSKGFMSIKLDGTGLQTFTTPDNSSFIGGLVEGPGSILYGPTLGNTGTYSVAKIAMNGTGYSVIKSFSGSTLTGPLVLSGSTLFGTTTTSTNTVFKVDTNGANYTLLKTLTNAEGSESAGVTLGANSTLFFVNRSGATANGGSVVKLKTDGTNFTVAKEFLKDFSQSAPDGSYPAPGFTQLTNGELLIAVVYGGTATTNYNMSGLLLKIKSDDTFEKIFQFDGVNTGSQPVAAPTASTDGFYYGITYEGGLNDGGVIYKIKPDGTGFVKLHDFDDNTGTTPAAGVIVVDGKLYGTTSDGGDFGKGVIYRINADGTGYEVILHFNGANGAYPAYQKLVYHNGFLWMSVDGGNGNGQGVIIKLKPDGSEFKKVYDFENDDYFYPSGNLLFVGDDIVAALTRGGNNNLGAIVKVAADGSSMNVLHAFTDVVLPDANWSYQSGPVVGPDGLLWGLEPNGGSLGTGVAFKMNTDGSSYAKVQLNLTGNLTGYLGPWFGLTYVADAVAPEKKSQTITFDMYDGYQFTDGTLQLVATASSGLPVSFSSTSDKVSINNNTVTFLKPGHFTVTAKQDGNAEYNPATPVDLAFCIYPERPTIAKSVVDSKIVLTATSSVDVQWRKDDVDIPNATNKTYTVTEPGFYYVIIYVDGCPQVSLSVTIDSIPQIVGLEDDLSQVVSLYPNPANNEIFVKTNDTARVKVIDVMGRVINTQSIKTDESINIIGLNKGVYYMQIEVNGQVTTKKFLKN